MFQEVLNSDLVNPRVDVSAYRRRQIIEHTERGRTQRQLTLLDQLENRCRSKWLRDTRDSEKRVRLYDLGALYIRVSYPCANTKRPSFVMARVAPGICHFDIRLSTAVSKAARDGAGGPVTGTCAEISRIDACNRTKISAVRTRLVDG